MMVSKGIAYRFEQITGRINKLADRVREGMSAEILLKRVKENDLIFLCLYLSFFFFLFLFFLFLIFLFNVICFVFYFSAKEIPETVFIEIREHYVKLCELLEFIDENLSGIILLSCINNLYFICYQLLNVFK